jgi:hypothetical protein
MAEKRYLKREICGRGELLNGANKNIENIVPILQMDSLNLFGLGCIYQRNHLHSLKYLCETKPNQRVLKVTDIF